MKLVLKYLVIYSKLAPGERGGGGQEGGEDNGTPTDRGARVEPYRPYIYPQVFVLRLPLPQP